MLAFLNITCATWENKTSVTVDQDLATYDLSASVNSNSSCEYKLANAPSQGQNSCSNALGQRLKNV